MKRLHFFRHKQALLRWVIFVVTTVAGVLFFSELGQFLVWQLIGVKVPGIELNIFPDSAAVLGQGLDTLGSAFVLDVTELTVEATQ
ncbi:hypothetical protein C9I98_24165 [Photobacterium sanctipauli]|uniref:Uncharacterized protein n=1 Tax=Photobacterium sanctipauli TaxID=1342794 RepID=A0A2T3NBK5_9GAMM|nr:hypothetical protein [Photobacterium sanctipauli]PSW11347.1 hypothetical protein C9I98_24165 [Photobacterium sanctipauli]